MSPDEITATRELVKTINDMETAAANLPGLAAELQAVADAAKAALQALVQTL